MTLLNGKTGQKALYALPMGQTANHVHVWKSLLERAGFTLADIPRSGRRSGRSGATRFSRPCAGPRVVTTSGASGFRCRPTSADTSTQFDQFMAAYEADYVTRDGRLVIDDPEDPAAALKAIDSYTAIYRNGCTPPDSVTWTTWQQ